MASRDRPLIPEVRPPLWSPGGHAARKTTDECPRLAAARGAIDRHIPLRAAFDAIDHRAATATEPNAAYDAKSNAYFDVVDSIREVVAERSGIGRGAGDAPNEPVAPWVGAVAHDGRLWAVVRTAAMSSGFGGDHDDRATLVNLPLGSLVARWG